MRCWDLSLTTAESRRFVRVFALALGIFANNDLHLLILEVLLKFPFFNVGFVLSYAGQTAS